MTTPLRKKIKNLFSHGYVSWSYYGSEKVSEKKPFEFFIA
jgi:hypothetical protein